DGLEHFPVRVVGIDPFDIAARRHDIADPAVADVEDALDDLLLGLVQQARFLAGGDQKFQFGGRMQGFFARPRLQAEQPQHQVAGKLSRSGSIRCAIAGSPIQPKASEEMVMPSWVAARLASRLSTARCSAEALALPALTSSATRLRRTDTSENSAATKNPFAA